jgi:hypothetical protein
MQVVAAFLPLRSYKTKRKISPNYNVPFKVMAHIINVCNLSFACIDDVFLIGSLKYGVRIIAVNVIYSSNTAYKFNLK